MENHKLEHKIENVNMYCVNAKNFSIVDTIELITFFGTFTFRNVDLQICIKYFGYLTLSFPTIAPINCTKRINNIEIPE